MLDSYIFNNNTDSHIVTKTFDLSGGIKESMMSVRMGKKQPRDAKP